LPVRPAGPAGPAPPSTSFQRRSTQQRGHPLSGDCCLLCHARLNTERCFPSHSPTLRPWITGRFAHVRGGRRPTWRGFGARSSVAGQINRTLKHTLLYRALFSASRESFSLRRGLDFDLTLVQAEHHLWSELADRLHKQRRRPIGSPSTGSLCGLGTSAHTSQRGIGRNRAGGSHRTYASTALPTRPAPLRQGTFWCRR
jgi:hypothetical protein